MARQAIKTISTAPAKFIPSAHKADTTLSEAAPDINDRPLVFMVRKMSRDDHFKVREMLEFKDDLNPGKGLKGTGDVAKFIWENNVLEVRNVILSENGETKTIEVATGVLKNSLWETEGMDVEMNEAIMFARESSVLNEAEAKN